MQKTCKLLLRELCITDFSASWRCFTTSTAAPGQLVFPHSTHFSGVTAKISVASYSHPTTLPTSVIPRIGESSNVASTGLVSLTSRHCCGIDL